MMSVQCITSNVIWKIDVNVCVCGFAVWRNETVQDLTDNLSDYGHHPNYNKQIMRKCLVCFVVDFVEKSLCTFNYEYNCPMFNVIFFTIITWDFKIKMEVELLTLLLYFYARHICKWESSVDTNFFKKYFYLSKNCDIY